MPKIQIIIPAINLWDKYTKSCIESIKTKYPYRILLIDNNSTDNTKEEAGKLVSATFSHQRNEECWSCAKSWNFGIRDAFERGYDYVLILNNDIILHPEAIDRLVERLEEARLVNKIMDTQKTVAMVSCLDVRSECPSPENIFGLLSSGKEDVAESEHPNFSAYMIDKECWDKIGEFDESFRPAYFEDNDYHYRMKLIGMKAITLPTAMFYHYGSRTQNEAFDRPVVNGMKFEMNRLYYKSKWGGVPNEEKYTTPFNKPNEKEI